MGGVLKIIGERDNFLEGRVITKLGGFVGETRGGQSACNQTQSDVSQLTSAKLKYKIVFTI